MLRKPAFVLTLVACATLGSIATLAAARQSAAPPAAAMTDELPDRIAKVFSVAW